MPSLADAARSNPKIREILEDQSVSHHEAAARIYRTGYRNPSTGLGPTESSVRRARSSLRDTTTPAPTQATPKDMPTFTEYEGPNGRAALFLPREGATEEDLLRQAGFDPDSWRISGAVNCRKWMRYDQEWLFYYKFDAVQGESEKSRHLHVDDLVKIIRKRSSNSKQMPHFVTGGTFVVVMSDWQIGKSEGGRGSADTVARWMDCLAQARQQVIFLRKAGVVIDRLAILSVGDLVEGCKGHYDMQTFLVDLDRRGQNKVVRELITKTILTLAPMFVHTTIACIGGNHGENRDKGKAYTTFADNDDVAVFETVKEAFDLAEWGNLTWVIPNDELSICVELSGVNVGLVHGHQFRGGANAWKKAEDWWRGGDFGQLVEEKVQILNSGHFHFKAEVNIAGKRSWMQHPTIDPGSKWYTDMSGNTAIPGQDTYVVSSDYPLGYDWLRTLHPSDTEQVS